MTKTYSRLLTAFFCLFLAGLFVWHLLLPDRSRSDTENRTLAQWPEFTWSALKGGSYTKDVETYFADQFPLRDEWTGLKAHGEQAIGKMEYKGVYLCGDTLISKVETPDEAMVHKNIGYVTRLDDATDIPVLLGLIPSAAEIWKEKLPLGAQSWNQGAFIKEAAETTELSVVDFGSGLASHADESIFYRTDHHWTTLGAYYGYAAVMESLDRVALPRDSFDIEVASQDFNGTLYSTSGVHWLQSETMEFWVPDTDLTVTSWRTGEAEPGTLYDWTYLAKKDKYSAFLGGNQPLCVIENEQAADGGKLLIVRDSYSDALAPFLAQSFSEVHLLDLRYYHSSVSQYAKENGIDQIIVLYSVPNFITDQNLLFLK